MKRFYAAIALAFGVALLPFDDADAARVGGGRSVGAQRQSVTPQKQATPPTQAQPATPAPAAPQPAGMSRWLGPLAGLAAGIGLGWLFSQGGFGGVMGTILMALLAGAVIMVLMRLFMRPKSQSQPMQYAGLGNERVAASPPSQSWGAVTQADSRSPAAPMPMVANIPAGFDVEGFVREAKRNFVRLQEANDRGDLQALRAVATDEMFETLKSDLAARGSKPQQTDVVALDASLLEVVTEGNMHWASVRFSGSIREDPSSPPTPFEEIWNLQKPADGSAGWLLAGIQQVS